MVVVVYIKREEEGRTEGGTRRVKGNVITILPLILICFPRERFEGTGTLKGVYWPGIKSPALSVALDWTIIQKDLVTIPSSILSQSL